MKPSFIKKFDCLLSKKLIGSILIISSLGILSCKKDLNLRCEQLKAAAFDNNVETVKMIISSYISALPSTTYNEQNVTALAEEFSKCDINYLPPCFNCIKTLPPQTELVLQFNYNGVQTQKVIDLSYSKSNRIVFKNIHD